MSQRFINGPISAHPSKVGVSFGCLRLRPRTHLRGLGDQSLFRSIGYRPFLIFVCPGLVDSNRLIYSAMRSHWSKMASSSCSRSSSDIKSWVLDFLNQRIHAIEFSFNFTQNRGICTSQIQALFVSFPQDIERTDFVP